MLLTKLLRLVLITSFIGLCSHEASAQYADLGSGALKERIWWFDWSGFTLTDGATRTFNTSNGLSVTVSFSNVSGPTLAPSVMNTWYGSVLHLLYNFSNPTIKPALYNTSYQTSPTNFKLVVTATRNGVAIPIQLIVADAEASATNEVTTLKTNGSNWSVIDFFRNSQQTTNPIIGCNTSTVAISDTYGNQPQTGQNPVLRTGSPLTNSLSVDISMDHGGITGQMGIAFGVLEAVDRGDLPSSFGFAQHQIKYSFSNICSYSAPFPTTIQANNLKLGSVPGDADGIQGDDDNTLGVDEDAISTFPIYNGNGSYSLIVPLLNTTGANAYLSSWFDLNENGVFESVEKQTSLVANNATSATITWTGLPSFFQLNKLYAFRFRLSSDQSAVQSPNGFANDGEVEDYLSRIPQVTSTGFISPDTICVNTLFNITSTSVNASTYNWNFCVANSSSNPVGANIGGSGYTLPVFMDYAKEGNNYYGFVTNNSPGKLIRLDFGNSLLNTPIYRDFGDLGGAIPNQCEGVQVIQNEGKWYVIVVGGQPVGRIVKVEFGTSLANNSPVAVNWGNVGGLAYPTDLHVFQQGSIWYGLTLNAQTNTISRFNFTNSFSNTPTGVNLGAIGGLNYPTGIHAISKNNLWYAFVINNGNGLSNSADASITRLDFGNSLLNTPTGTNLGNPNNLLSSSRDLTIYQSCDEIFGYVVNNATGKELVKLNFNNNLTAAPTATKIGNTGSLNFPHSVSKLFRVGSDLYSFITNANSNTVTRLRLSGCTNSGTSGSTLQNPPPISYNAPGVYNINLTVDDGLPTQSAFCKQVVVLATTQTPRQQKDFCEGDSVLLTSSKPSGNLWNNGSTATSIYAKTPGIYWVQSSAGGCVHTDSFAVTEKSRPVVNLGRDTAFCMGDSIMLNAGNSGANYLWHDGSVTQTIIAKGTGTYHVEVERNGCKTRDSIILTALAVPVLNLSNDTTICKPGVALLSANGDGILFNWSPAATLSGSTGGTVTAVPNTTTTYHVEATGANTCKAKDSVTVKVFVTPVVNLGRDTTFCSLDSLKLDASNPGANFYWQNGQTSQSIVAYLPGTYDVAVSNNGCIGRDTILITRLQSPTLNLSNDTSICRTSSIQLSASGADSYVWSPASGLSATSGSTVIANPNLTTTYYVYAENSNGCKATDSLQITVSPTPVVRLGADTSFCSLESLTLDAGNTGATYLWSNNQTTQTINLTQNGTYHVTVNLQGCSSSDTLMVTTRPSPIVTISQDTAVCKKASLVLSGDGGDSYLWWPAAGLSNPTSQNPLAKPDTTTTYYLQVTNSANCSALDSVTITVNPAPAFSVKISKPLICDSDTATLFAAGGDIYTWSPAHSVSDPTIAQTQAYPDTSTRYKVVIEHNGCGVIDSLFVQLNVGQNPDLQLTKSNDINCFQGTAVLSASGGRFYTWQPATGLSNASVSKPVVATNTSTTYHVMATSADGCQSKDSITIYVNGANDGSGFVVPSAFSPNGDGKNDCFGVPHWGAVTKFSLNLYNRWGERVFHADDPSQCWNGYYKGLLQPNAVFVYWIEAETMCGKVFRKGTFALIR